MMETLEIIREVGSLGLVAVMVVLAGQHLRQQRDDYHEAISEMMDLIRDICDSNRQG